MATKTPLVVQSDGTPGQIQSGDLLSAAFLPEFVGVGAGQTLIGGANSAGSLTLQSTSHATKGVINFGSAGTSFFDEANNYLKVSSPALGVTQTSTAGLLLENPTAAVVGAQQITPPIVWSGAGWATASGGSSQSVKFRSYVLPIQSINATGQWLLQVSLNGGAYTTVMGILNNGVISAATWQATAIADNYLANSYILADGSRPLTAGWDTGAITITANQVALGSAANTITFGAANAGTATIVSTSHATKGLIYLGAAQTTFFDENLNYFKVVTNSLGAVVGTTSGLYLANTTAAALGAQQYSAPIIQEGQGWKTTGSASQSIKFREYVLPIQGAANATAIRWVESSVGGGAFGNGFGFNTSGNLGFNVTAPVARVHVVATALALAPTIASGFYLQNTTAAAAGAQQISGSLVLEGQGWKTTATAASQSAAMYLYALPVQGAAAPTVTMRFDFSIAGGAVTNLAFFDLNGLSLRQTAGGNAGINLLGAAPSSGSLISNGLLFSYSNGQAGAGGNMYSIGGTVPAWISGAGSIFNVASGFTVATGTGTWAGILINSVINQTSTASGISRGLYVSPTLTTAVDFRAIESTGGKWIQATTYTAPVPGKTVGAGYTTLAGTFTDNSTPLSTTVGLAVNNATGIITFAATNVSVVYTDAVSVYIDGAPTAGTNMTITRAWSLYIAAGNAVHGGSSYFGGVGVAPTAFVHIAASTTGAASLRIVSGTAPTSPNDGDMWYDGTNVKFRVGASTKTFTLT